MSKWHTTLKLHKNGCWEIDGRQATIEDVRDTLEFLENIMGLQQTAIDTVKHLDAILGGEDAD